MNSPDAPHHSCQTYLKAYLPYALSLGALLSFVIYIGKNFDRYRQLFDFSLGVFLSLFGLVLGLALINGLINYFLYRAMGAILTLNESVGLAAVNTLANQLPFAGGLIAKGVYLKKQHQLAYTHFLSATMALYVCFVSASGVVALIVLAYWTLARIENVPVALFFGFASMVASAIFLYLPVGNFSLPGKLGKRLKQLSEGWRVLGQNGHLVLKMIGFQVIATLLFAARLWISFHTLSQNVSYTECLLFSSATVLTRLISIAPGGLGVREGIVAGLASVLGFDPGISAVAVGLDRLVATTVILVLGTFYTYHLSKKTVKEEATVERE